MKLTKGQRRTFSLMMLDPSDFTEEALQLFFDYTDRGIEPLVPTYIGGAFGPNDMYCLPMPESRSYLEFCFLDQTFSFVEATQLQMVSAYLDIKIGSPIGKHSYTVESSGWPGAVGIVHMSDSWFLALARKILYYAKQRNHSFLKYLASTPQDIVNNWKEEAKE